jgi:hypothetical protein
MMLDANSVLRRALRDKVTLLREQHVLGVPPAREMKGILGVLGREKRDT